MGATHENRGGRAVRKFLLALCAVLISIPVLAATAVVDWNQSFVNVRSEPSQTAKKVGAIQSGAKVDLVTQKGDWAKVRYAGGEGWVVLKSLRVTADKPATMTSQLVRSESETAPAPAKAAEPVAPAPPQAPAVSVPPQPQAAPASPPPGGYLSDIPDKPALPEVSIGKTLVSMVSGLLLVLAIIGAVVWAMRRFLGGKFPQLQGTGAIRVLSTRPVAQRQALMLVEVGGEIFLIGQTDSELRLISKIESPDAIDRLDYLFTFKATKFESELRRELDVESREGGAQGEAGPAAKGFGDSIAARLARLRGRQGSSESQ